jgi:polyphosphate glucokinase
MAARRNPGAVISAPTKEAEAQEKKPRAQRKPAAARTSRSASSGPKTLCLDIGGTGIKAIVLDEKGKPMNERQRIETPRPATPAAVLAVVREILKATPAFDRVSVGFPGVVKRDIVHTAPNLDQGWAGFPLGREIAKLTSKPSRVLNDAGVQGYGVIQGKGTEMILTLGTGMGCAIFVDGKYVPNVELAHHPFNGKHTYEEHVSNAALKKCGKKKWNQRVRDVIDVVIPIFNPDVLYLGGGNARVLKGKLPPQVKIVENIAGLLGGIALWKFEG